MALLSNFLEKDTLCTTVNAIIPTSGGAAQ